ncbi:hypothetical protein KC341_g81 [Hortaea werneckii]|nr:hypothetical protein KC341_g81 [Hortaea werneckii]
MADTIPANAIAGAVMAHAGVAGGAVFLLGGVAGVEALEDVALGLARHGWCDVGDVLGGGASRAASWDGWAGGMTLDWVPRLRRMGPVSFVDSVECFRAGWGLCRCRVALLRTVPGVEAGGHVQSTAGIDRIERKARSVPRLDRAGIGRATICSVGSMDRPFFTVKAKVKVLRSHIALVHPHPGLVVAGTPSASENSAGLKALGLYDCNIDRPRGRHSQSAAVQYHYHSDRCP